MSIDPLKAFNTPSAAFSRATTGSPKASVQSFEEILNEAKTQGLTIQDRSSQASEMMQTAQMKMMRGLFDLLEDSDGVSPFIQPRANYSLLNPAQGSSQKPDKPDLQPATFHTSLASQVPTERDRIDQLIERVAKHVSLAPDLIRSVVHTESKFKPDATSAAGAQGLMQLMPETAKELGVENSLDPLQNLLGGSRYLKQLLDKYDGDLDHALAAYNWGQGNVDRKGLEKMPKETQDYLARVKSQLARA